MKKIAIAALLSALVAAPAFAAEQGGYIGVDIGQVSYDLKSQFSNTSFASPGSTTIGGGYRFNQYVGVEAGYSIIADSVINTRFSNGASTIETLKASSMQVAAVGSLPLGSKFDLFGKLGLANTTLDYTAAPGPNTIIVNAVTATSASKVNPMLAIGGQFNINKHFGIRAQYRDLGKVTFPGATTGISVKIISIGAVYSF